MKGNPIKVANAENWVSVRVTSSPYATNIMLTSVDMLFIILKGIPDRKAKVLSACRNTFIKKMYNVIATVITFATFIRFGIPIVIAAESSIGSIHGSIETMANKNTNKIK